MKPYYDCGGSVIYNSDCRDIIPGLTSGSVDLILTDPPYGVNWQSTSRKRSFPMMAGDDGTLPLLDILRDCIKLLREQRHLYVFGLKDFGDLPIGESVELIWDKGIHGLGNLTIPWAPSHERILFGCYYPGSSTLAREDDRRSGRGRLSARLRRGSVLREPRLSGLAVTFHPTQKPTRILRMMIESSSLLGETVFDPFMGSGSTLVAARLEGRSGIGIEVEERYCEVAAKRLAQLVLPLVLPLEPVDA